MNEIKINKLVKCTHCGELAKVNFMDLDDKQNLLRVAYICDCGYDTLVKTEVKFI